MKKKPDVESMLRKLPFVIDWCEYKGETCVAQINWDATAKAGKPMMDLSYCMTKALNQNIDKTVQWDRTKFKPSNLGTSRF
jgi:hypothetical protein